jgi:hypothetical protein
LMARELLRQLDLHHTETDIVLGGGLLTARDPLLTLLIREAMAIEAPNGVITFNDVPAIAGAALLGFDYLGVGRAAEDRLRSQLRLADAGPASAVPSLLKSGTLTAPPGRQTSRIRRRGIDD